MKKHLSAIAVIFMVTGFASLLVFQVKRERVIDSFRKELVSVAGEKARLEAAHGELESLKKNYPVEPGIPQFVELLFVCAQEAAVKSHEVATVRKLEQEDTKVVVRQPKAQKKDEVAVDRLKVTVAGPYRNVAEYVRLVQNIKRFKSITALEMKPDNGMVKASLDLDLYSLRGAHDN